MSPRPLGEERVACVLPSPRTAATRWPATHSAPFIEPDVLEVRAWPEEGKKESAPWSALATLAVVGSPWKAQP